MTDSNVWKVAGQLSPGQVSTVRSLSASPCGLGCNEGIARNLAEPRSTRPALVVRTRSRYGFTTYFEYALNAAGLTVQQQLGGPFS